MATSLMETSTEIAQAKIKSTQRLEFFILLVCTLLASYFFRNSDLDFWAARYFYHPENAADFWPKQNESLWLFFYHAAPWLTGILMAGSLAVLVTALFKPSYLKFKKYSVFVFLVVALGPGLFVNSIFKPYWGRPRPREVIELGGHQQYREFYRPNLGGPGKSFPCGHCSVGFAYGVLFWLMRRKNLRLGILAGLTSVGLGLAMGVGRIAAGGHFFSDVIFAGLIVYWVCHWLYYFGLKIPYKELSELDSGLQVNAENRKTLIWIYSGLGLVTLATLLLASPFNKEVKLEGDTKAALDLRISIDQASVDFILDSSLPHSFELIGDAKGFGFPSNKLIQKCESLDTSLVCEVKKKGLFSDFESVLRLRVNPSLLRSFELNLKKGQVFQTEDAKLPPNFQIHTAN